jgi:hypothetical protein
MIYVSPALTISNSVFCTIYVFRMIVRINSDYFLKQRKPVDPCGGEELCFLCGTGWILKYYLDDFRLQKVDSIAPISNFRTSAMFIVLMVWNLMG